MQRLYSSLPKNATLDDIYLWAVSVSRERQLDLQDYNNQVANNPVILNVPTSSNDIRGTEKVGDIAADASYLYIVVDNSGALEWRRVSISTF